MTFKVATGSHAIRHALFGYWESDSILGAKTVGEGIHTEVEPVDRFIIARKTDALSAGCKSTAQHAILSAPPPCARLSVPMDNGTQDVPPLPAESPVGYGHVLR